ncbi:hypothetical protein ACXIUS_11590 [Bosea thiooxidans]|nr:hypothetical protein [Bosea sp. (in: a-proteobacteria)]
MQVQSPHASGQSTAGSPIGSAANLRSISGASLTGGLLVNGPAFWRRHGAAITMVAIALLIVEVPLRRRSDEWRAVG